MQEEYKKYRRTGLSEMRPVTQKEQNDGPDPLIAAGISINEKDLNNGSPLVGDMIARNPVSHDDKWLVAEAYFKENLELVE